MKFGQDIQEASDRSSFITIYIIFLGSRQVCPHATRGKMKIKTTKLFVLSTQYNTWQRLENYIQQELFSL
jgi:hypothetical protein